MGDLREGEELVREIGPLAECDEWHCRQAGVGRVRHVELRDPVAAHLLEPALLEKRHDLGRRRRRPRFGPGLPSARAAADAASNDSWSIVWNQTSANGRCSSPGMGRTSIGGASHRPDRTAPAPPPKHIRSHRNPKELPHARIHRIPRTALARRRRSPALRPEAAAGDGPRVVGKGLREFKSSVTGEDKPDEVAEHAAAAASRPRPAGGAVDHLGGLRSRIFVAGGAVLLGTIAAYAVHGRILRVLIDALPRHHRQLLTSASPSRSRRR